MREGRCHAIEISPAYVDVAVRRWQDFTGNMATLDGDGRSFDEIANARTQKQTITRHGNQDAGAAA
jgi:hypothetical protein